MNVIRIDAGKIHASITILPERTQVACSEVPAIAEQAQSIAAGGSVFLSHEKISGCQIKEPSISTADHDSAYVRFMQRREFRVTCASALRYEPQSRSFSLNYSVFPSREPMDGECVPAAGLDYHLASIVVATFPDALTS